MRCGTRAESVSQPDGPDGAYTVALNDGDPVVCQKLLVATGRAPRVTGIGLETIDAKFDEKSGVQVDDQLRVAGADSVWAIGDMTGVAAVHPRRQVPGAASPPRTCSASPRGPTTPRSLASSSPIPQVAAVGEAEGAKTGTVEMKAVARTATYIRQYAEKQPGFLTLVSDGQKLTGAYAVGPEAGEWLGQATLAVRAGCRSTCCATRSSRSRRSPRRS